MRVTLVGAEPGDKVVNTAVARAESTEMRMRTSDFFEVYIESTPTPTETPTETPTDPGTVPPSDPTTPPSETPLKPSDSPTPPASTPVTSGLATTGAASFEPLAWLATALFLAGVMVMIAQRREQHDS